MIKHGRIQVGGKKDGLGKHRSQLFQRQQFIVIIISQNTHCRHVELFILRPLGHLLAEAPEIIYLRIPLGSIRLGRHLFDDVRSSIVTFFLPQGRFSPLGGNAIDAAQIVLDDHHPRHLRCQRAFVPRLVAVSGQQLLEIGHKLP